MLDARPRAAVKIGLQDEPQALWAEVILAVRFDNFKPWLAHAWQL
jgi:hypothetical protein